MAKVKIELNRGGVRELLRSKEMMSECEKHARSAVNKLGEGYSISKHTGKNRVNVSVVANTREAIKENKEENTVIKAVMSS